MGNHVSPYRTAPARAPRRKRSTIRRLHDIGRRCVAAGYRPPFIVFVLWLFVRPLGLVIFGAWRLLVARRAIRAWHRKGAVAALVATFAAADKRPTYRRVYLTKYAGGRFIGAEHAVEMASEDARRGRTG